MLQSAGNRFRKIAIFIFLALIFFRNPILSDFCLLLVISHGYPEFEPHFRRHPNEETLHPWKISANFMTVDNCVWIAVLIVIGIYLFFVCRMNSWSFGFFLRFQFWIKDCLDWIDCVGNIISVPLVISGIVFNYRQLGNRIYIKPTRASKLQKGCNSPHNPSHSGCSMACKWSTICWEKLVAFLRGIGHNSNSIDFFDWTHISSGIVRI